jgi:hypothetical protein
MMQTMRRRHFLYSLCASPLAAAQQGPPRVERVEKLTAAESGRIPLVHTCHLGYVPAARKIVVYRAASGPAECTLRDIGGYPEPWQRTIPLNRFACDFGPCLTGDFSAVTRPGMYQITIAGERSVPFFIDAAVWRRTLPMAMSYYRAQRCGTEAPNFHPVCHLDDARRRDTGEHLDTTGGWHDAGDLRKWMSATMTNGFAILEMARLLGKWWDLAGTGLDPLLDEMRWGNRYFHKMQDRDGRVFDDVAGGVNGDNSDNHWTDNVPGTKDDRYVNPRKTLTIQAMFTALQAMCANAYASTDAAYAKQCLEAAERCWRANPHEGNPLLLAYWARAASFLFTATKNAAYRDAAVALCDQLLALQQAEFALEQKKIRGYWRESPEKEDPFLSPFGGAQPAAALLELLSAFPSHANAPRWRDALALHIEGYVLPMCARNAYGIFPYGLYIGSPTPERFRPIEGRLTYRHFHQVRKQFWWQGLNCHYASFAAVLARAAKVLNRPDYRLAAYRQLEWILGANPFGASMMTGQGIRHPYPHSRFVGLLPGGIMNGIAGNVDDEPVLDMEYGFDWRTTEYWSPHVAWYIWAVSALEAA